MSSLTSPGWLRPALCLVAALLTVPIIFAQPASGTIRGRVLSPVTQEYLRNVEVTVAGTNITTFTGDDGSFALGGVPSGERELVVNYTGYETATARLNVSAGATAVCDFELAPAGAKPAGQTEFAITGSPFHRQN